MISPRNLAFAPRDLHCEPNEHHEEEPHDERATFAYSIGEIGSYHGKYGGGDVDWDSEELGLSAGVVEILDDGGQKQTDSIKRADDLILSVKWHIQCNKGD